MMHHFDPERALELIERERVTTFGGVPAMVMAGARLPPLRPVRHLVHPQRRPTAAHPHRRTWSAASEHWPVGAAVERLRPHRDVVGHDHEHRESTTSPSRTAWARPSRCATWPSCRGFAGDEPTTPCPRPRVGELWIKGPNVVRGYWGRPDETAQIFTRRLAPHRRRRAARRRGLRLHRRPGQGHDHPRRRERLLRRGRGRAVRTSRPSPTAAVIGVPEPDARRGGRRRRRAAAPEPR